MQEENEIKRSVKNKKKPVEFPMLALGITAEVKRPPLSTLMAAGKLPGNLLNLMAEGRGTQTAKVRGEELPGWMECAIELARVSFLWPKILDEADPESDDELSPGDIPVADLLAFLSWVLSGCPNIPVETTSGPMTAEALSTFREDSELPRAGEDGGEVRTEAVEVDGDSRRDDGAQH